MGSGPTCAGNQLPHSWSLRRSGFLEQGHVWMPVDVYICVWYTGYMWMHVDTWVHVWMCVDVYICVWTTLRMCVGMCGYMWMCVGVCGCMWTHVDTCMWVGVDVCGYIWLHVDVVDVSGYVWMRVDTCRCVWMCMHVDACGHVDTCGYVRMWVGTCGYMWRHVDVCGCVWRMWAGLGPRPSWRDYSAGNLKSGPRVRSAGLSSCPATILPAPGWPPAVTCGAREGCGQS